MLRPARRDRRITLLRRYAQQKQEHYKKRQYYLIHNIPPQKSNRIIPHIGRKINGLKDTFEEKRAVSFSYADGASQSAFSGTNGKDKSGNYFLRGRQRCAIAVSSWRSSDGQDFWRGNGLVIVGSPARADAHTDGEGPTDNARARRRRLWRARHRARAYVIGTTCVSHENGQPLRTQPLRYFL